MTGRVTQSIGAFCNYLNAPASGLRRLTGLFSPPTMISTTVLGSRFFSTPGKRISAYFEKYNTVAKRCQFMSEGLYNELPEQVKVHAGTPDASPDYLRKILELRAQIRYGGLSNTRWGDHSINQIETLAGIGDRYSSSSFSHIAHQLPETIRSMGTNRALSILEFGGFGFVDSFKLCEHLEKFDIHIAKFTGVDFNLKGLVAAGYFNDKVARIANYNLIRQNALDVMKDHIPQNDHIIAIRFLAVLSPLDIISFFENLRELIKPGDLLVFNYTQYNDEVQNVGSKSGYSLENPINGIYTLNQGGTNYQTFLTEQKMASLLRDNNLTIVGVPHEDKRFRTSSGDDESLGQFDKYTRVTIFAARSN